MVPEARIALGGEVLSFVPADGEPAFTLGGRFLPFVSDAEPTITFDVHCAPFHFADLGQPLFETPRWVLHRVRDESVICLRRPGAGVYQIITLKYGSGHGEIYLVDVPWLRGHPRHVFEHPAGEVLSLILLAQRRGVLLHASAAGDQGRGLLFSGVSGAGKSTLIGLWQRHTSAELLSDDRIVVRRQNGSFEIFGTPWHGDVPVMSPASFPLHSVFVVRHAAENSVRPLDPAETVSNLLARAFPPFWDREGMAFTLGFLEDLSRSAPCYDLGFVPDQSAVDFLREVIPT
jgi:hypothetical protein